MLVPNFALLSLEPSAIDHFVEKNDWSDSLQRQRCMANAPELKLTVDRTAQLWQHPELRRGRIQYMPRAAYATRETEFWYNVSPQGDMPLAGIIDSLVNIEVTLAFFKSLAETSGDATRAILQVQAALLENPDLLTDLRQFLGISDKRAYLDLSYLASRTAHPDPNHHVALCGCYPWTLARHPIRFFVSLLEGRNGDATGRATAILIADYLVSQGLLEAAESFGSMSLRELQQVHDRLITPKESQQKAAKRRGHGCEAAAAAVFAHCGVQFIPAGKVDNPMGAADPHVDLSTMTVEPRVARKTHAFDLIVTDQGVPRILVQSLIHTSDPGQYGVDKSNESLAIRAEIDKWNAANPNRRVELWGLVDGVGFSENKIETINKLVEAFDQFFQLGTLYKIALRLHSMNLTSVHTIQFSSFYDEEDVEEIETKYAPDGVRCLTAAQSPPPRPCFNAGNARIFLQ